MDQPQHDYSVDTSDVVFRGRVVAVRKDVVSMPGGGSSQRDVVEHPGAVGVVALDDQQRVLLVTQYRHPVRRRLDELPAGLLDVADEDPLAAARRELVEEAGLEADTWHVLADLLTSPGMTDEGIRIYLARGVREVERDVQEHEESEMTSRWVPLEEAADAVLSGRLQNASAVAGILAADRARQQGFASLRPAGTPWPGRRTVPPGHG